MGVDIVDRIDRINFSLEKADGLNILSTFYIQPHFELSSARIREASTHIMHHTISAKLFKEINQKRI